jgi:HlyD family secretion protein
VLAAAIGIPMALSYTGFGSSPAEIQSRVAILAPMRTAHRLRIAKILVTPGQSVRAGELLVQMDTSEIDADLALAHAKLAYIEIDAGWRQIRLADGRARTSHALAVAAEGAALDGARVVAEAERDRAELAQLDINLAAEQRLVGDQLASSERLKAMKLQRAALSKKVEEYRSAVRQARKNASGANRRLSEWSKAAEDPKDFVDPAQPAQRDVRSAAIEIQRQEISRLETDRKRHEVRAPFDGRVGEVLMQVGDLSADPDKPIVTLVQEPSNIAIAYLKQADVHKVRVGDIARLVPRDLSGSAITGRVTALAPNITEIPIRFRKIPTLHEFGRNVYIQLDTPANLPGQSFEAVFRHGSGGGT